MSSGSGGSGKKGKGTLSSSGSAWYNCPKCQKRLPRSASTKHASNGDNPNLCETVYPFIYKEAINALLVNATTTSKIQNLPFIKCSRLSSSTIFLPEELIRESGLKTFSWVKVYTTKDSPPVALRIWPIPDSISASSSSGNVMMTKDGFLANNLTASDSLIAKIESFSTSLSLFTPIVYPAKSVTLEIDDGTQEIDQVTFEAQRFAKSFKSWFKGRLITKGNILRIRYYAEVIGFKVKDVTPLGLFLHPSGVEDQLNRISISLSYATIDFVEITDETEVNLVFKNDKTLQDQIRKQNNKSVVKLEDVGGLDSIVKELLATINFIFTSEMNVAQGIILHGHSGTGKSYLIQALCDHFKMTPIIYNEFGVGPQNTNSSNSISKVFQEALSKSPSAIIIENLDALAPSKSEQNNANASNFAINLQSLIPSLNKSRNVIIIATATDVDAVSSNLRSPKIFGKEIELPVPSKKEREDILNKLLSKINHSLSSDEIKEIAGSTHGFVGADLHGLCTQSVQCAVESSRTSVTMKDMVPCLKSVKPSAIKSILVDVPNVRWDDIGGQDDLKFKLKQAIEWPLKHPEAFQRLGVEPPKGVLMYGPPGCSKTMIAKAIATESGLNFISVKGSELFSKWVGESEKAVRDVFRKARQVAPCVVFFDEIDSLGGERGSTSGSSNVHERVLAQLLVELDGIEPLKDVTIVAATNRPDIIDQALLRPGRLDRIIYVPLPDAQTRNEILKIKCQKMPIDPNVVDIKQIVQATEGYSGAELTALCHEAAMNALEEDISSQHILQRHFTQALKIVKPRISKDQIEFYENYHTLHKR